MFSKVSVKHRAGCCGKGCTTEADSRGRRQAGYLWPDRRRIRLFLCPRYALPGDCGRTVPKPDSKTSEASGWALRCDGPPGSLPAPVVPMPCRLKRIETRRHDAVDNVQGNRPQPAPGGGTQRIVQKHFPSWGELANHLGQRGTNLQNWFWHLTVNRITSLFVRIK